MAKPSAYDLAPRIRFQGRNEIATNLALPDLTIMTTRLILVFNKHILIMPVGALGIPGLGNKKVRLFRARYIRNASLSIRQEEPTHGQNRYQL